MTKRILVGLGFLATVVSTLVSAQSKPSIQGVWKVTEVTTTGPNAGTNKSPQPSLYIFTAKHYSMMRVNSDKPREVNPPLVAGAKLTDADMLKAYREWQPLIANSGTYEFSGSTLMMRALVAKSTAVMANKSGETLSVKLDGNTLTMTSITSAFGGKLENPTTVRLTRVE